ncbi:hypothetical protein SISSUDRAFT_1034927 [Sistotremastrum suecicum HHB10207 ss-3]|uniref:Uncharacterized protein n=1 Tax=Sistotremastrum suecicum HHB10207 ss-3 TaxID=1314776 RepID=A0A166BGH7_9AGAM|nr:hypothetical protein SISSUDRAFT_1034927 [Sistotremastrum suecicum HHB10207 ss-3]
MDWSKRPEVLGEQVEENQRELDATWNDQPNTMTKAKAFNGQTFAVLFTAAALHSPRGLGPADFSGFPAIHWIYWFGPTVGFLFSTALYSALKQISIPIRTPNTNNDQTFLLRQYNH